MKPLTKKTTAMGVAYRPMVRRTGSCFAAGLHDPMADANALNHLEVKKND